MDVLPTPPLPESIADISADDLRLHVEALASEAMEGRLTGSKGEQLATDYVAKAFERLGRSRRQHQPRALSGEPSRRRFTDSA